MSAYIEDRITETLTEQEVAAKSLREANEKLEELREEQRRGNRNEAFTVLRQVERVARYKDSLNEAIGYLHDDDAALLAEFCATVLRITARLERVLPNGVSINTKGHRFNCVASVDDHCERD